MFLALLIPSLIGSAAHAQTYYAREVLKGVSAPNTSTPPPPEMPTDTACTPMKPGSWFTGGTQYAMSPTIVGASRQTQVDAWCTSAKPVGFVGACVWSSQSNNAYLFRNATVTTGDIATRYAATCS